MKYKFLPHTADIKVEVYGNSIQELFSNSLQCLNFIIKKNFVINNVFDFEETIEVDSIDTEALLIDFLSEILFLSETRNAVFCKIIFTKFDNNYLQGKVFGVKVNSFDDQIKAITYHQTKIEFDGKKYKAIIIFDI